MSATQDQTTTARPGLAATGLAPVMSAHADDPAFYISSPGNGGAIAGTAAEIALYDASDQCFGAVQSWMVDGKPPVGSGFTNTTSDPNTYTNTFEIDTTDYASGKHTFSVSSTDCYDPNSDSYVNYSSTREFVVGNNAPSVTISSPSDGATVSGRSVSVNADAIPDPDGSQSIDRVEFFLDGTSIGTDTLAPYDAQVDSTTLSNGPHTLQAVATDSIGLVGRSTDTDVTVANYHSIITSAVSKTAVAAASPVVITGVLGSVEDGAPITSARVKLQVRRADQTGWTTLTTVTSGTDGSLRGQHSPLFKSYYRWTYAGDAQHTAATSSARLVSVTPVVRLTMNSTSVRRGVALKGAVKITPAVGGQALTFQRRKLYGSWVTFGRGNSTPTSTAVQITIADRGYYDLRITRASNSTGQAATSNLFRIHVL